jgi:hypothetical protein
MAQLDGLITYISYAKPATISLCGAIEAETKNLMFGQLSNKLIDTIYNDDSGPLSERNLCRTHDEDETAVCSQNLLNP